MARITDEMKQMLATQLPIVATVTADNTPNIGPKRSLRLYDDHTLVFNENTGGQTLLNIRGGSQVAVAVIDRDALDGYRFVGVPTIHDSGAPYDNALAFAAQRGMTTPKYAVLIAVENIFTLAPGAKAGRPVAE